MNEELDPREQAPNPADAEGVDDSAAEAAEDELIAAALGGRIRRWIIPVTVSAAIICLAALWFWGQSLKKGIEETAETIPTEEITTEDSAVYFPTVSESLSAVSPGDSARQPETVMTAAQEPMDVGDTIARAEPAWMSEEEFYLMLNAAVSDTESALLEDDTSFFQRLFAPMVVIEEPEPTPERIDMGEPESLQPGALPVPPPSAIMSVLLDSSLYRALLDSLTGEVGRLQGELTGANEANTGLRRELDRYTAVKDSVQAAELRRLAKIVDVMAPAQAASMLQDRSEEQVVEILFKLKPRTAAKVIEAMPAAKRQDLAARITGN